MSVGYNVSEGSMDFNSGTNLTSGIQDRCCTRWWRSRNGFERWMVIVVIFLSCVIVALSIAVGLLDQIAHPSEPDLPIVNPVAEVGNLFNHMEEQVNKASQLMADTDIIFNQTLRWLKTVETRLSDDANKTKKRFAEDTIAFERFKRDTNLSNHNTTTVGPIVNIIQPTLKSNTTTSKPTTMSSNDTRINTTLSPAPTTEQQQQPNLKLNTTTSKPTSMSSNDTRINTTLSPAHTTENAVVANLTAQLNKAKHSLRNTSELLEEKIKELNNLTDIYNNQTLNLTTTIELLANRSLEIVQLKEQFNETKQIVIQKDNKINELNSRINVTRENLKETNKTLMNTKLRITFLETYINETTGILIPVLEILKRMDRPISRTYHSVIEAKELLKQLNNTLYQTDLPLKQKEKNQDQTKIICEFVNELEIRLGRIKINFEEMENQSIAITEPLKKVQAKYSNDENNTQFVMMMNVTKFLFNESVMNMETAEIRLSEINNHLTNTVANLTQTIKMLGNIKEEIKTTVKVNTTSVTTPMIRLNTTTPLPNSNYSVNSNLTSHALKSSSTVLFSGKLEIFALVISVVIYHGYGIMF